MALGLGVVDSWWQVVQQIRCFDWWQLRRPQNLGRWAAAPRLLVYSLSVISLFSLTWGLAILLVPAISGEEKDAVLSLRQQAMLQQKKNLEDAVRTLELGRHNLFLSLLLHEQSSEVADVTKNMEWIRSAATVSNVQLMSVTPEFVTDDSQTAMVIHARLMLPSLTDFWTLLINRSAAFDITKITLEYSGKSNLYNMHLGLLVEAASHITPMAGQLDSATIPEAGATVKNSDKTISKGFLVRAGHPQFMYLIRDEQGRLTSVAK